MKKVLLVLLVGGMLATTANAATLWMQFQGGGNEITVAPSDEIVVEIWFDIAHAGDTVSTVFHENQLAAGLDQTASVAVPTNWSAGGLNGPLGPGTNQFAVGADDPLTDSLGGVGSYHVGYQLIHQNIDTGDWEISFGDPGTFAQVLDAAGGNYLWWGDGTYAGYYTYGQGACYVAGNPKTGLLPVAADPLIVHCIPEPSSLALLALGGLALIRRR